MTAIQAKAVLGPMYPGGFPEAWASDWGEDRIGLWQAFTFRGQRYAFRWIKPGTFMMGSPEDEPGRSDNELQHEVTLTRGFWLGETTVPQALWQAAMDGNPSEFKGEDRPVDSVSWHDAMRFIQALNQRKPDLRLCLPTGAQWEYACRAGTTTPFHFGRGITTDQVNYDGRVPLDGSPKGEWRRTTLAVKALPANDWGLYQMHGNVWEWCSDVVSEYRAEPQVDPSVAGSTADSGQVRVLRGGSWSNVGKNCRSAVRNGDPPGNRYEFYGFRLARGQEASGAEK